MFRSITFSLLLISGLFLINCSRDLSSINDIDDNPKKQIRALTQNETQLVESCKKFGLKLFKKIIEEQPDRNIFISPLSVSMALGMTLNGPDGETYTAMQQTLEFEGMTNQEINEAYQSLIDLLINLDDKVLFEIANSIWYRNTFNVKQDFLETNQEYFDAEIAALDFNDPASVDIINNWVSEKTHDKIEKIINSIDPLTVMFLINAIYFKGTWQYEFDKENTEDDVFNLSGGGTVDCKMMKIRGRFDYYEDDDVQIIDLPYGDGDFSMTIFLPKPGVDIDEFTGALDESRWQNYLTSLNSDSGTLELPKFKLEYKLKMNDVLKALGMSIAFDPQQADFSRINPNVELYISKVLHKTFVQVDEEGTEAAAVTVVAINFTSIGGDEEFYMTVNHPFMFVIREHHSETILFIGKMIQPEWEE
jgi:serpin B